MRAYDCSDSVLRFFCVRRHQLHLSPGHTRRDVRAAQTAAQSHYVHAAATGGAGDGVRADPLSGRVHTRRPGDEDQPDGGARSGKCRGGFVDS